MDLAKGRKQFNLDLEEIDRSGCCDLSRRGLASFPLEIAGLNGLKVLDLSHNDLTGLPPQIVQLAGLRELRVEGNLLESVPPEIGQLAGLEILDLGGNRLTSLPPEIGHLTGLRELRVEGNLLESVPPEIGQLAGLEILDLGGNRLTSLPPEIGQLGGLRTLDLGSNQFGSGPPKIALPTGLRELKLGFNELTTVPSQITRPANLQALDLSGNLFTEVPTEITGLSGLSELDLADNQIVTVPSEIGLLIALRELRLVDNQISFLPPEIRCLTGLEVLEADGNELESLPSEISHLTALRELWVRNNRLASIPPRLGLLAGLRQLWLGGNQLTTLPPEISALSALETLDLSKNQLAAMPPGICALGALETLDLSGNQLTTIPPEVGHLNELRRLWLGGNQLTGVPREIGSLKGLQMLDLGANRLAAIPPEVCLLANLRVLWLDGNQISALPHEISQLVQLRKLWLGGQRSAAIHGSDGESREVPARLAHSDRDGGLSWSDGDDFSGNQISTLPPEISQLSSLETLGLGANQITCTPPEVALLTALRNLDLSGNQLSSLPAAIGQLTALQNLDLSGNQLSTLPAAISRLSALRDLDLSENRLVSVPNEIGHLGALQNLDLSENRLSSLPAAIGQLTALGTLDLSGNQLDAVPDEIGQLAALGTLDLSGNRLSSLPATMSQLAGLGYLELSGNQLLVFPEQISQLSELHDLILSGNQLTRVPPGIGEMTRMSWLDLHDNRLTALPWQLAQLLETGASLSLDDNPFKGPVLELLEHGPLILAGYLRSLEHATPHYEAKVLLVGEGNVGKTSLIAALRGDPFVAGRTTTHGIEIRSLDLPHPAQDLDLSVRAWDFGGQQVYRVSHQFFFTENALYLVVWKPREGQEQNELDGWLRRIRLRVGNGARVLVVATHCAAGRHPDLDYPTLKRAFPDLLAGQFEVDNETGHGLAELRQVIAAEAAALPQMGQLLSPQWVAARDEILSLAESEPQISRDQFTAVCQAHAVGSEEAAALLVLLHILGRIVYYGDDQGLRNFVVLNPEWLTKAISYVLEDLPTRHAGGILDHGRLREIWQHPPDGPGYPERYHPYFLRLMEKFDISYRLEDDPYSSLVAQLTPHDRPNLLWDAQERLPDGTRRLTLICKLSEQVPGLIAWLTVRHHRAATGLHWRNGVFLRHPIPAYASEALIELTAPDLLWLEVRAPSPNYFFDVLRDSIEDLMTRRWPGLGYELLIPCPGTAKNGTPCQAPIPMEDLRALQEESQPRYLHGPCRTWHDVSTLLTGFPAQQPELDRIYAEITQIRDEVGSLSAAAAQTADLMRKTLRAVTTEITDCPHLFTLTTRNPAGIDRLTPGQRHYRLVLWCEHPGNWHPWQAASYDIVQPTKWLLEIAPAATVIIKILQIAAPIASAAAGLVLTSAHAQNEIQLATAVINALPASPPSETAGLDSAAPDGQLSPAQGKAWRAVRELLLKNDTARAFGDLRRVQASSGEFLWVCPDHYPEYDPGLPMIPNIR